MTDLEQRVAAALIDEGWDLASVEDLFADLAKHGLAITEAPDAKYGTVRDWTGEPSTPSPLPSETPRSIAPDAEGAAICEGRDATGGRCNLVVGHRGKHSNRWNEWDRGDPELCWFCGRKVGWAYLIAGYDTFEEQRLACLDCDRAIHALREKGWLAAPPSSVDGEGLRAAASEVIAERNREGYFAARSVEFWHAVDRLESAFGASGSASGAAKEGPE